MVAAGFSLRHITHPKGCGYSQDSARIAKFLFRNFNKLKFRCIAPHTNLVCGTCRIRMPMAFFVGVVVSLCLNFRLSSAKEGEARCTSPPDESGGRYYISHKAKPILQTFPTESGSDPT